MLLGGLLHMREAPPGQADDVICFSHLRWNFVHQRPQHLLSRCARGRRVFFFEEPVFDAQGSSLLTSSIDPSGVTVVVPHLCGGREPAAIDASLRSLLDSLIETERIQPDVLWYYTPMALAFSGHLRPRAVVYDCMDELSGFAGAPAGLRDAESALLARAHVVFTGGRSLYDAKRHRHENIHAFPSSVDVPHFARARARRGPAPDDQKGIPHPRLGFYGVVDERFDRELIACAAALRPEWHFVIVGPVVKIDPATLPRGANIHYLGAKSYDALPDYLAGWDAALLPFARNDATRYISPTKTPEYLAAGCPVVSTSIRDVVHPYGELGLAHIADDADAFVAACEAALAEDAVERQRVADALLCRMSWDATWHAMADLIAQIPGKDCPSCSISSSLVPVSPAPSSPSASPLAPARRC
jgi:glycosyltransferase involved in cell wall biosynthesis